MKIALLAALLATPALAAGPAPILIHPGPTLSLPWAEHGCDVNISGPSGQISTYTIERFLAAVIDERRTMNDK